ncbi:MAG TPA: winged helix-turn-helix domain-containing protein, partial [Polyangia bacterium]|nr:winged helix-turn-helix domain-containing protein [Polyangia bacterium]
MSPAHPLGRRFFTPHFRLLPLVNELPLSAGARVTLTRCLRRAQKTGNGDALEGEALFWTTPQTLAQETGLSLPTQRRRLKELRAAGFLRWRLVDQGKALPNGAPAEVSSTVFYVQVRALETSLRVGTELA